MVLKLYNTLTREKKSFKPIKDKIVGMYTCGPTVYDYAHIGNFRAYVCSDILKRFLKYKGFRVKHVMNLTDVDDKIIKGANKEGISLKEFTGRYEKAFFEDIESLNIDKADMYPKATEHIKEMVGIIKKLLKNGTAYRADDGSVYYDISKFKDYGKLSNTEISSLKVGARVKRDSYEKEEANDFALWKAYDKEDRDVFWETEIGKGRPGWHIECSAMSMKYLGKHFDIHAGGVDLKFPHHENEIAQSEAYTGEKFANYWFHNEHLLVDGRKMSKSLGNFFTLRDLRKKGHNARAIRYLLLSVHYREQLNFTEDAVKAAENAVQRLDNFMMKLMEIRGSVKNKSVAKLAAKAEKLFEGSMDDDLNTSMALGQIFDLVKDVNTLMMEGKIGRADAKNVIGAMEDFGSVLGILRDEKKDVLDGKLKKMIAERENARKEKDFANADRIRDELRQKGIILEDTKEGVRWKKAN
ncbi:cysteine--tRNA ligase [Candidatus Woesearchaeota archaeon]|nr:cysteine--tRNA ligase [Candidatus Woesearchaeota archaeon]